MKLAIFLLLALAACDPPPRWPADVCARAVTACETGSYNTVYAGRVQCLDDLALRCG